MNGKVVFQMKYDFEMDVDTSTSVGKIASYIEPNSKILEFGPGNGRMTNYLKTQKNCQVSVVELDEELFLNVKEIADDAFLGNIEEYSWMKYFENQTFDYIVFADVLEHLMNPKVTLANVKQFLKANGEILITFPNLAHNSVLINLFNNKLEWTEYGLLDATHKTFYTQEGFEKVFSETGYYIKKEEFTFNQVGNNETTAKYEDLPIEVHHAFKMRPYGEVYQYFFVLTTDPNVKTEIETLQNSNFNHQVIVEYCLDQDLVRKTFNLNSGLENHQTIEFEVPENATGVKIKPFPENIGGVVRLYCTDSNQNHPVISSNAVLNEDSKYLFTNMLPTYFIFNEDVAGTQLTVNLEYLYQGQYLHEINQAFLELYNSSEMLAKIEKRYEKMIDSEISFNPLSVSEFNKEIALNIDEIYYDRETQLTTITGWGLSNVDKRPIEIDVYELDAVYSKFEALYREDVVSQFKFPAYNYGYRLTIKGPFKSSYRLYIHTKEKTTLPIVLYTENRSLIPKKVVGKQQHYLNKIKQKGLFGSLKTYFKKKKQVNAYDKWILKNENYPEAEIREEIKSWEYKPKISIVVPVYNVEKKWLDACISSLTTQFYTNWELCLADDASPNEEIKGLLEDYALKDQRIKIVFRKKNGHISEATNSAIEIATGDYIGFMDNDDELTPIALYRIVKALNKDHTIDFFYTDEDKMYANGKRFDAFFKPNWNPTLLMQHNYITHFVVVKQSLLHEVGGLDSQYNGSQDYDFVLRATEKAKNIEHVKGIAYHWRAIETSTALNPESKNYAYIAGKKALESSLTRKGISGNVHISEFFGCYKIDYAHKKTPKVSIVLNNIKEIEDQVIAKFLNNTNYNNFELILPIEEKYRTSISDTKVKFYEGDLNQRIVQANAEFIVTVNANTIPENSSWLKELLNYALLSENGIVTGKLSNKDGFIENIGVSLDLNEKSIIYPERFTPKKHLGYYYRIALPRNIQATTEDILIFAKDDFNEIGGFDLSLGNQLTGIDFSIAMFNKLKKNIVYTSYAQFVTLKQYDRVFLDKSYQALLAKWSEEELEDPYGQPEKI